MNQLTTQILLKDVLSLIGKMPVWILQALFVEITVLLKDKSNTFKLQEYDRTDMLPLYIPSISEYGELIIERSKKNDLPGNVDARIVRFLKSVQQNQNIIDICITNNWTLENGVMILLYCIKHNFIQHNFSPGLYNLILFISNEVRIGEFLIRKNKLTSDQLDQALQLQKQLSTAFGEKKKIVEVLINMGKIKHEEVLDYLTLKEFSKTKISLEVPKTDYMIAIEKSHKEFKDNYENIVKKCKTIHDEKIMCDQKMEELSLQLQQQIAKNTELLKKVQEYERKLDFFKKL